MIRFLVPSYSIFTSEVFNGAQQEAMKSIGGVLEGVIGAGTNVYGLGLTATTPPSMSLQMQRGGITSLQQVDASPPGSGSADANSIVKFGLLPAPQNITFTAPTTSGQSINYLVEVGFEEIDTASQVLNYIDPNTGIGYVGNAAVNTERLQTVAIQVKAGAPANAGSQPTPAVDAGYVGLYVVTVNNGQTQITSNSIANCANIPTFGNAIAAQMNLEAILAGLYVPLADLSTGATGLSVVQRDSGGGITASAFHGVADSATVAASANVATLAANATNAVNAIYANSAGYATQSGQASLSSFANVAGVAATSNSCVLANNSSELGGYLPDTAATPSTAAIRDASGNLTALIFNGESTSAAFADLAERYEASEIVQPGDVVQFGGDKEIKLAIDDYFGVVSSNPALTMNAKAGDDMSHPCIALDGRVPVKVTGPVEKFDYLILSGLAGLAIASKSREGAFGRALEEKTDEGIGFVLASVKRGI